MERIAAQIHEGGEPVHPALWELFHWARQSPHQIWIEMPPA